MQQEEQDGSDQDKQQPEILSLEALQKGHYFTLTQAREKLGNADARTLRKWIQMLGVPTYTSPLNGSVVLISLSDLRRIAKRVGRALEDDTTSGSTSKKLALLEQQLVERDRERAEYEQKLTELRAQVEDYERRITSMEHEHNVTVQKLRRLLRERSRPPVTGHTRSRPVRRQET
jgi:DNA repair exonuclease SbcCD ATPase subunit